VFSGTVAFRHGKPTQAATHYGRPSCWSLFLALSAGRVGPCIAGCNEDGRYHAVDKYTRRSAVTEKVRHAFVQSLAMQR